jgi:hypothetical protein
MLIFIVETSKSLILTLINKFFLHLKVCTRRFLIEVYNDEFILGILSKSSIILVI